MILVTGGAGFIGSNLVAGLREHEVGPVAVVDELGGGDKWRNLAKHDLEALVPPDGLSDFLESRGKDVSYVFHLGAITATTERDADLLARTNIRLSESLWSWCAKQAVPFVYASSAATYGDGSEGFSDAHDSSALARLRPRNAYAWSKHAFDRWVAKRDPETEPVPPQWVGLKFFNVYGPNEYHKGEMRSLVSKAHPRAAAGEPARLFRSHRPDYDDGAQKRDFIHVQDCVNVMLWLTEQPNLNGVFNVGTGRAQSWLELMTALYASVGREPAIRWIDIPETIRDRYQYFTEADMTALRQAGYDRPFLSVEEGVADYVQNYLGTDDPYR